MRTHIKLRVTKYVVRLKSGHRMNRGYNPFIGANRIGRVFKADPSTRSIVALAARSATGPIAVVQVMSLGSLYEIKFRSDKATAEPLSARECSVAILKPRTKHHKIRVMIVPEPHGGL